MKKCHAKKNLFWQSLFIKLSHFVWPEAYNYTWGLWVIRSLWYGLCILHSSFLYWPLLQGRGGGSNKHCLLSRHSDSFWMALKAQTNKMVKVFDFRWLPWLEVLTTYSLGLSLLFKCTLDYRKMPKIFEHPRNCCNYPKIWTMQFYHRVISQKGAGRMANSVDQIRLLLWSALFAQAYLSENLEPLGYIKKAKIIWKLDPLEMQTTYAAGKLQIEFDWVYSIYERYRKRQHPLRCIAPALKMWYNAFWCLNPIL